MASHDRNNVSGFDRLFDVARRNKRRAVAAVGAYRVDDVSPSADVDLRFRGRHGDRRIRVRRRRRRSSARRDLAQLTRGVVIPVRVSLVRCRLGTDKVAIVVVRRRLIVKKLLLLLVLVALGAAIAKKVRDA